MEFRTWGTAHTPGDQIVHPPAERIVIAGGLLEERMFATILFFPPMVAAADMDLARWEVALADIIALRPRLIVPGHGNLGGVEIATEALGYFRHVRAFVRSAGARTPALESRVRARYSTWENTEFIKPALQSLSQVTS